MRRAWLLAWAVTSTLTIAPVVVEARVVKIQIATNESPTFGGYAFQIGRASCRERVCTLV